MALNQEVLLELDWWSTRRNLLGGKSVSTQEPDLTMETDASILGWGAVCRLTDRRTLVSDGAEVPYQLSGTPCCVKAFAKDRRNIEDGQQDCSVLCEPNGGYSFPSIEQLGQLWQWCLERNLSITAEHLPWVENCVASTVCGRRGIQDDSFNSRVAITPTDILTDYGVAT